MATRLVRFDFKCENAPDGTLTFTHNLPSSLVRPEAQALQGDPGYIQNFTKSLQPIMNQHEAACRAASSSQCHSCGSPTTKVLLTPMSWLHIVEDPFLHVWCNPVCNKGVCETQTRQKIQNMMMLMSQEADKYQGNRPQAHSHSTTVEVVPCNICGKTEPTKKCGRCKVVAYCGKDHQVADWTAHKKVCVPKDG